MLDPAARRLVVASAVRLHVARVLGTGPLPADTDLLDAAARLRPVDDRFAVVHHLGFDPGYPGATSGVEAVGSGRRLVLACTAEYHGTPAATVLTTLITGRTVGVSAPAPEMGVPAGWTCPTPTTARAPAAPHPRGTR